MKGIGLLLCSSSLILTALQARSRQRNQIDTLRELCAALARMAAELAEHGTPLPQLMDELSVEASALLRPFFEALTQSLQQLDKQSFSESWRQAVDRHLSLRTAQKKTLKGLGGYLGRYSGELQRDALMSVRGELIGELQRREAAETDRQRLTAGLTAAVIVILLILNL